MQTLTGLDEFVLQTPWLHMGTRSLARLPCAIHLMGAWKKAMELWPKLGPPSLLRMLMHEL